MIELNGNKGVCTCTLHLRNHCYLLPTNSIQPHLPQDGALPAYLRCFQCRSVTRALAVAGALVYLLLVMLPLLKVQRCVLARIVTEHNGVTSSNVLWFGSVFNSKPIPRPRRKISPRARNPI